MARGTNAHLMVSIGEKSLQALMGKYPMRACFYGLFPTDAIHVT